MKTSAPGITPDQLADAGQQAFMALAMKDSNGKEFQRFVGTMARLKTARAAESKAREAWEKWERAKAVVETAQRTPDGGLTAETLAQIERQLKML